MGTTQAFFAGVVTAWIVGDAVRTFSAWRQRPKLEESGHWSFPIDTMRQILDIPVERRERFLEELPKALRSLWNKQDKFPVVAATGARWADDDLGELRTTLHGADAATRAAVSGVSKIGDPA